MEYVCDPLEELLIAQEEALIKDLEAEIPAPPPRKTSLRLGSLSIKFAPEGIRETLKKKGFGEMNLLAQWDKIIGLGLAKYTQPEAIKYINGERVLVVKVFETRIIECQHQKMDMMERIHLLTGYALIDNILFMRMQKMPVTKYGRKAQIKLPPRHPHPFLEKNNYSIKDDLLKDALNTLAHYVIPVQNKPKQETALPSATSSGNGGAKAWVQQFKQQNKI